MEATESADNKADGVGLSFFDPMVLGIAANDGRIGRLAVATSVLVAVVVPGCSGRSYELVLPQQARPPAAVIEIWEGHRDVLVRALEGDGFTLREFRDALRFFERITCLPAHSLPSHLGPLPGERLEGDMRRWDDWLRANGQQLHVRSDGETLGGAPVCDS